MLLIGSLTACAGSGPPRSAQEPRDSASLPAAVTPSAPRRSGRGNPPFYDVLGKRYHVLPTSAGYVARGVASWYGRDFHGLSTSSGETYDMHAMTAAHTTLPLPTWVEVTNLTNGKRVVVKVNDRGPFVDNRIIDLSYAAATALDMVQTGTTRVEVRTVAPPLDSMRADAGRDARGRATQARAGMPAVGQRMEQLPRAAADAVSAPAAPASAPMQGAVPAERMFLQIGAFAEAANAERLVARLRASGFANSSVVSDPSEGRRLHRVWLGPIRDSVEYDALDTRLRSIGVAGARLVVDSAP
jgi:rare lipoprotein A